MEIANIRLRLAKVGNDVPVIGVTPFEAVLLHVLHGANNGGSTYGDKMDAIELKGEAKTPTGKTTTVTDKPAVFNPVKGSLITAAIPATGTSGQPGFVAGKEAVYCPDTFETVTEAVTHEEPTFRARTNIEEYNRLKVKYGSVVNKKGDKIVGLVWAGLAQNPPQKFSDIKWSDVQFDGVEVAPLNYATGGQVVTAAPGK